MSGSRRPKSPWYSRSRRAQEHWKATTHQLPDAARAAGRTWVESRGERVAVGPFPVCLPESHAAHNLLPEIRAEALRRFADHGIQWHGATPGPDGPLPSTHLLDSQVQCVNALLCLAQEAGALLEELRTQLPEATRLLPLEDGSPVAFEWIGAEDYLGEGSGKPRRRGDRTTSIDALLVAERSDGGRTAVLVEWKFTESYPSPLPRRGWAAALRRKRYTDLYAAAAPHFSMQPPLEAFFQEPHYQLLRQALLAQAMVEQGEHGVDRAVMLHVVPADNRRLRATLSPELAALGDQLDTVWSRLLPGPVLRYACMDSRPLLARCPPLRERYLP